MLQTAPINNTPTQAFRLNDKVNRQHQNRYQIKCDKDYQAKNARIQTLQHNPDIIRGSATSSHTSSNATLLAKSVLFLGAIGTIASLATGQHTQTSAYLTRRERRNHAFNRGTVHPAHDNRPQFSADHISGSIGRSYPLNPQRTAWQFSLRNDNNNASLPDSFRTWFYVRGDHLPTQSAMNLSFDRFGFSDPFKPIYSYDQSNWQYFDDHETRWHPCTQETLNQCRLELTKQFERTTVWIARTYPYTPTDLQCFLNKYNGNPYLRTEIIGNTESCGFPIYKLTIGDRSDGETKQLVWLHARTHPAETGSSFVLEGLISTLLSNDPLAQSLRENYEFHIVPMHNVDGIVKGNYRTTPSSKNLEAEWRTNEDFPWTLKFNAPQENRVLNARMLQLAMGEESVVLALNLHSSNSAPQKAAFFYPHFGNDTQKYSAPERALWNKQLQFIASVSRHYDGRITPPPAEGGNSFLKTAFPETWWWKNKKDAVNAITLETTYGTAGFDHWVAQNDLRNLGVALLKAITEIKKEKTV